MSFCEGRAIAFLCNYHLLRGDRFPYLELGDHLPRFRVRLRRGGIIRHGCCCGSFFTDQYIVGGNVLRS
ncbi:MAG: hypothetical protein AB4042_07165 [Leptolyngbyaceae cyanobacterium]